MEKQIVDIFDISYEGAGVGKNNGKVVFVPKTLEGERVEVEKIKNTSSFSLAKLVQVVDESKDRIVPKCPYFSECGGCDFQHCNIETESKIKQDILKKELKKVGFSGEIGFVASDKRFFYRNKIKLEVKGGKIGYFKAKSQDFFAIKECPIATEEINKTIPIVEEFLKENKFKGLKSVYIKQVEDDIGVCFLFDKNCKKDVKNLKKIEIFDKKSLFFAFGDVLENNSTQIFGVFGNQKLLKNIDGHNVEIDISAFNQINDNVAEKLYNLVEDLTANKRVVNAYSGQGLLTYLISKKAKFVYGIEYQKTAHESAEKLKKLNENYKIENVCGKVENCLSEILLRDRIDLIVLDPAREGCDKNVLNEILRCNIEKIVYISCNFATLTRDLKVLTQKYAIESVKIFDMFPCTANMETVVILGKN